jgi:hypothetical protein
MTCVLHVPQKAWDSHLPWLRGMAFLFLLMQYPVSALLLLAWNSNVPISATVSATVSTADHRHDSSTSTRVCDSAAVRLVAAVWAGLVLSMTLWLVDIAAVCALLSGSARAVSGDQMQHPVLWWVLLPLRSLHWVHYGILYVLRATCCSEYLPAVCAVLDPKRADPKGAVSDPKGAEEVWAENHMFARMPMEALLEALPQMVLQGLAYFLAPRDKYTTSLLTFMLSVTFSIINVVKAVMFILEAAKAVHPPLGFGQSVMLLLQLKGSFRVPAALMHVSQQEVQHVSISIPPNLTPLQEVGFFQSKLANHSRQRKVLKHTDNWALEIKDLQQNQVVIRPVGFGCLACGGRQAEQALLDRLQEAQAKETLPLEGMTQLELRNCYWVK